ncbi:MAG TPA: helix-turn-helix domain-containing protein [Pirellulaceae bacterium]|jgi:hypothetical protein|nr:helix-turn-helix domain-containing protein [Pirellulaceae bacterium]
MSGLLSLEEAAALLKMTPAQLKSMQERGEIFPVRGGAGLQFKREEVERFAEEHQITLSDAPSPSDSLALGDDELELGGSAGLSGFGSDDQTGGGSGGSFVTTGDSMGFDGSPSALELAGAEEAPGGSSLALQADDLALAEAAPKKGSGSAISGAGDDDLVLDGGNAFDDDASVLSPSDSGVKLNPDDSGLSLEASGLDLASGGSGLDMSTSASADDSDIVPLDDADPYSQSAATQLKRGGRGDDFDLESPAGAELDDESESQVIPVLSDDAYADMGDATQLGGFGDDLGGGAGFGFDNAGMGMGGDMGMGVSGAPAVQVVTVPVQEKPYSIWNVLGLLLLLMFMIPGLVFMTDLLLNMWDYEGEYTVSTSIVDSIVNALQLGG